MRSRMMPHMTNEEVLMYLSEYDEQSFDQLPDWLQQELQETNKDAREHRIMNNERNIEDFKDHYKRGKHFNILT